MQNKQYSCKCWTNYCLGKCDCVIRQKNYNEFTKRNGYVNGKNDVRGRKKSYHKPTSNLTLAHFMDNQIVNENAHRIRAEEEEKEYNYYMEHIYEKKLMSITFMTKHMPNKELRKLMNDCMVSHIDTYIEQDTCYKECCAFVDFTDFQINQINHLFISYNNTMPWNHERLIWLSRVKDSGLFSEIPNDIIKIIISHVNSIGLDGPMKHFYYNKFMKELQTRMLKKEEKIKKVYIDKVEIITDCWKNKIPVIKSGHQRDGYLRHTCMNPGDLLKYPEHVLDLVTINELKNGTYNNLPPNTILYYATFKLFFAEEDWEQGAFQGDSQAGPWISKHHFRKGPYVGNITAPKLYCDSIEDLECNICCKKCTQQHYSPNDIVKKLTKEILPEIADTWFAKSLCLWVIDQCCPPTNQRFQGCVSGGKPPLNYLNRKRISSKFDFNFIINNMMYFTSGKIVFQDGEDHEWMGPTFHDTKFNIEIYEETSKWSSPPMTIKI